MPATPGRSPCVLLKSGAGQKQHMSDDSILCMMTVSCTWIGTQAPYAMNNSNKSPTCHAC